MAFLVKVIGLRIESVIVARFTFGALVSAGGVLLVVAMVSGAAIARGLVRGKPAVAVARSAHGACGPGRERT
jgi:hypothetical protein